MAPGATNEQEVTEAFKVPKTCKAGVVNDHGANFFVTCEDVDVPTPGTRNHLESI
jgi:hypothetical protein